MPEFKYSIIRYIADQIRDEPINVGLILHSPSERFLAFDWDLKRLGPRLARPDRFTFKHFEEQLEPVENEEITWEEASFESVKVTIPDFLDVLADNIGNKIRFTPPRGCITDNPDAIFDELFKKYVSAGLTTIRRVTKRTLVTDVKQQFIENGVADYLKSRPSVVGRHKEYRLPLGIHHTRKMFIEVLKLGTGEDKNYRAMAAVARLWQDARSMHENRLSDITVLLHNTNGRVIEGERLLEDDGVLLAHQPQEVLGRVNINHVQPWE